MSVHTMTHVLVIPSMEVSVGAEDGWYVLTLDERPSLLHLCEEHSVHAAEDDPWHTPENDPWHPDGAVV